MLEYLLALLIGMFIGFMIGMGYVCDFADWLRIKFYQILDFLNGPRFF